MPNEVSDLTTSSLSATGGEGQDAETPSSVASLAASEQIEPSTQSEDESLPQIEAVAETPALPEGPQKFDFRQPSLLTSAEMRKLRACHDEFARSLATRLSIHLRLDFGVQVIQLDTLYYPGFIEHLSNSTHVAAFKVKPLIGVGLLEVSPKLGFAIIDRLCGGAGNGAGSERALTEIEVAVLDQAILLILKEWCQIAAALNEPTLELLAHETNPRFLQTSARDTSMLRLALQVRMGDCVERLQFGFPFEMIEPVIRRLTPVLEPTKEKAARQPSVAKWHPSLNSIPVPLTAHWDGLQVTARQIAQLKPGDLLPVPAQQLQHTQLRLAKLPKFAGRLGKCGTSWAVELTETMI